MTVLDIYKKYRIHAGLQMHQLRVAAVALMVCDAQAETVDTNYVVTACLFHDMGNIIKSNLTLLPELIEPEGMEYWKKVKHEFVAKYGRDEHGATLAIVRDIGIPEVSIELIANMGFSHSKDILATGSRELQIVEYADMRVGPFGVLSMQDRLEEGRKRYLKKQSASDGVFNSDYEGNEAALKEIERILFTDASITPEDIHDASVAPIMATLTSQDFSL